MSLSNKRRTSKSQKKNKRWGQLLAEIQYLFSKNCKKDVATLFEFNFVSTLNGHRYCFTAEINDCI